ncbi:transposase family protein [Embleya sp. NPDC127516]|uniref:transposase family protein n=1 Tax=Embleya sp. NPDC127516 TaxID=3363990 RepID=UPI0038235974
MVFTDRVIATLVILRLQLPHDALAHVYGVDRSTVTRAVHEIRPLLAARAFTVPGHRNLRLRTLADVFAYAASHGVELRIDGTEVRVRRPRANSPGSREFVSGKMRQNTKKTTIISDEKGRTLWTGAFRPGRQHDQTALKTEGICDLFEQFPQVKAKVDAGYRGLAKQFPDQVEAPPLKSKKDATADDTAPWATSARPPSRNKQSRRIWCHWPHETPCP